MRSLEIFDPIRRLLNQSPHPDDRDQALAEKPSKVLCRCIHDMSGLKHVHLWGSEFPAGLLSMLHERKRVELTIHAAKFDFDRPVGPLQSLKSNDSLRALDISHRFKARNDAKSSPNR